MPSSDGYAAVAYKSQSHHNFVHKVCQHGIIQHVNRYTTSVVILPECRIKSWLSGGLISYR